MEGELGAEIQPAVVPGFMEEGEEQEEECQGRAEGFRVPAHSRHISLTCRNLWRPRRRKGAETLFKQHKWKYLSYNKQTNFTSCCKSAINRHLANPHTLC